MVSTRFWAGAVAGVACFSFSLPVQAAITSITGFAEARLQEFRDGSPGDSTVANDTFPTTQSELPLQVVATFATTDPNDPAAAAVAAQFADPRELNQENPEEFAINLSLNSISDAVRYEGQAISQETRGVLFSTDEIAGTAEGETVNLTGRFFLDGALAIVSQVGGRDLTAASVKLTVTVERIAGDAAPEAVFSGVLTLSGTAAGDVDVESTGDIPTDALILTDLSALNDDFTVFRLLVIPSVAIDYDYSAVIGEPLTLRATVQVDAANEVDRVGVAAVLGTPTDTIAQVFSATQGSETAQKLLAAVQSERDNPTGEPAFPAAPTFPLLSLLCGPLGFGTQLGLLAVCLAPRLNRRRAA